MSTGKTDLQALKRRVGKSPFTSRLTFNAGGFAKCPFHTPSGGPSETLHLKQYAGGWQVTCFSCKWKGDAIKFVQEKDGVDFKEALAMLGALPPAPESDQKPPKKTKPMTAAGWEKWGREITEEDAARLAASRPGARTPDYQTLKDMGCRVKNLSMSYIPENQQGDYIGFPYRLGDKYFTVKMRHLDKKAFWQEHSVSQKALFNLDSVNPFNEVYVVESELDAGVLQEAGFFAVSVTTSTQASVEKEAVDVLLRADRIFLVGDMDAPGQECMDILQKQLPQDKTYRLKWDGAKDVGDLAKQLGDSFVKRMKQLRDAELEPRLWKEGPRIQMLTTKPVEWVADRLLPKGGLAMFCGSMGSTKTMLAMLAAKNVTRDYSPNTFLGRHVPITYPVIYIDRENSENTAGERARRLGCLVRDNLIYWGDWWEETPEPDNKELLHVAKEKQAFVIFDSLQDWYGDAKEIDNSAMVHLMQKFKRLARRCAGVLLLHHDAKYGEAGFRGATGIPALTDMSIKVRKEEMDGYTHVELREIRFRDCGTWEMDLRVDFAAGTKRGLAPYYDVSVTRDDTGPEAKAREAEFMSEVRGKKDAKNESDIAKIRPLAQAGKSPSTIERETGISRKRVKKLLEDYPATLTTPVNEEMSPGDPI